jgi:hypothetical protein
MRELYIYFWLSSIGRNAIQSKIRLRWRKNCSLRSRSKFKSQRFNSMHELYTYFLGCQASGAMLSAEWCDQTRNLHLSRLSPLCLGARIAAFIFLSHIFSVRFVSTRESPHFKPR